MISSRMPSLCDTHNSKGVAGCSIVRSRINKLTIKKIAVDYIQILKDIVLDITQMKDVNIDVDIYDYGISSIWLVQMVVSIERKLGKKVSPLIFIENTTIRKIAENLEKQVA